VKKIISILLASSCFSLLSANIYQPATDSIPCSGITVSAGPDQTICAGESVVIGLSHGGLADTSGYTFSWYPAINLNSPDLANPTASPTQNTTFILSVSHSGTGCVGYDTVEVIVKQPAYLMFFPPGPHYICAGQQVTLTAAFGFSDYLWDGPSDDKEGRVVQVREAGVYQLSATDAQGCKVKADSFQLHVRTPLPLQTNPSGIKKICSGQTAQFAAAQGFIAYNWHTPTGTVGGRFLTASVPGNYYVTATDANSCLSTSAIVKLEVNNPAPISTIPAESKTLCPDESVMLSAPEGFGNYFWITPSGQLPGRNILVNRAGEYQVKAFDSNGCLSNSAPLTLIQVQPATLEINYDGIASICRHSEKLLSASAGFSQYRWMLPAGSDSGMQVMAEQPGIYKLTALDSNFCLAEAEPLNLKSYPYADILLNHKGDTSLCQGASIFLSPEGAHTQYAWNTPQGPVESSTLTISDPGTYQVSAIDSNGCIRRSAQYNVHFLPVIRPVILSSGRDTLCPGNQIRLESSPGFSAHKWNTPAGTTESESLETNVGGIFSVTARDSNGCIASSMLLLIHESFPFKPQVHGFNHQQLCSGETLLLSADSGYVNYSWSDGSSDLHLPVNSSGKYHLRVMNHMGCPGFSDSLEINFTELPAAAFTYEQTQNQQGFRFFNLSEHAESWIWDFGDGHISMEQHPEHTYTSRGNWSVSLVVENYCGRDTVFRELKQDPATGLKDQEFMMQDIRLFPNPGAERLVIDGSALEGAATRILMQNPAGQLVHRELIPPVTSGTKVLDTRSLDSGIYWVIVEQDHQRIVRRWVKH
jgi:hypothetical protein